MEQNFAENDGLGKTIVGKAKSYVKHHAQARFTEYFQKEGEHNPMPRRGVQRHDFCPHLGRDFACSVTEGMSGHVFSCGDEVRVFSFSQPHRGNVEIRRHV